MMKFKEAPMDRGPGDLELKRHMYIFEEAGGYGGNEGVRLDRVVVNTRWHSTRPICTLSRGFANVFRWQPNHSSSSNGEI